MMTREEAIQNIKRMIGFSDTFDKSIFTLFPELAESEDEKIRKGMIRFLNSEKAEGIFTYEARQSWITWLEKQKDLGYNNGFDAGKEWAFKQVCDILDSM